MASGDSDPPADRYGETWADIYDHEHAFLVPSAAQLALLFGLAGGGRVLELGVGTGRVALPLAARGVDVHGLDASPSMVAQLRAKPGGGALPVTVGNMADPPVVGAFRLVYVVFNTFFGLLTQDDQVTCFQNVARLLEPDGVFLLECFVPDVGRFDRGQSLRTVRLDDGAVRLDASSRPGWPEGRLQRDPDRRRHDLGPPPPVALRLASRDRPDGPPGRAPATPAVERLERRTVHRRRPVTRQHLRPSIRSRRGGLRFRSGGPG